MPGMVRRGGVASGRVRRPKPAAESVPANFPPTNTSNFTGSQGTTQIRPDTQSDRKFNLGHPVTAANHAVFTQAPGTVSPATGGPVYPMVINQSGGQGNGHRTWHFGGEVTGTDAENTTRDTQYADHTSGIEHTGDTAGEYLIGDSLRVSGIGDAYRFVDEGVAYLNRIYASNIRDGFVEFDELTGDARVYDCLVDGCYSGFSDIGSGTNSAKTLIVDGVLLWLKPTVDTPATSGGTWCGGTGGCTELNGVWSDGRFRGSNGIWEGDSGSYGTVIVRNSWFRIDRPSAWGPGPMLWPGQTGAQWNNSSTLTIGQDVKILWTGASRTLDGGGNIQASNNSYPSTVPTGVQLVTGQTALDMWNRAVAAWKAAHGY